MCENFVGARQAKQKVIEVISRISALVLILSVLQGCGGGGGGSSPPSPSLSSNLPSSAFDDETIVVSVTARNFGSGGITYNATSNSLSIQQGDSDNQFVITGVSSVPGSHTISFSASDTSGKRATLSASIRIDAVATGLWSTTSIGADGVPVYDVRGYASITRGGKIYLTSTTETPSGELLDEKCFGSSSVSAATLTFEVWCAYAPDGYEVTDENYRLTGELEIDGSLAFGTYSLYTSSGGLQGTADVELERTDYYKLTEQVAPASPEGVYGRWSPYDLFKVVELISIDSEGNIAPIQSGGDCDVDGLVTAVDIELLEGNDYVDSGIFDAKPVSQIGCRGSGNFVTGNRDIVSGEGQLIFIPMAYYGLPPDFEVLVIRMSDSTNSYGGIPSQLNYWRLCSASGEATGLAHYNGYADQCSGQ